MTVKPSSHGSSADATVLPEIWGQHSLPSTHTQTKGLFFFSFFFFLQKTDLRKPGLALLSGQGDSFSDLQPLCDRTTPSHYGVCI